MTLHMTRAEARAWLRATFPDLMPLRLPSAGRQLHIINPLAAHAPDWRVEKVEDHFIATCPDVRVENHGFILLVRPLTPLASDWLSEHVAEKSTWFAGALAVEPRFVDNLIVGMLGDGLRFEAVV